MIHCLTNDPSLSTNDVFIDEVEQNGRECKTRFSFNAEFDGCLTVQKGETLVLCRHNNDGWSLGEFKNLKKLLMKSFQFKRETCNVASSPPTTWTCFDSYRCIITAFNKINSRSNLS